MNERPYFQDFDDELLAIEYDIQCELDNNFEADQIRALMIERGIF